MNVLAVARQHELAAQITEGEDHEFHALRARILRERVSHGPTDKGLLPQPPHQPNKANGRGPVDAAAPSPDGLWRCGWVEEFMSMWVIHTEFCERRVA